MSSSIHGKQGYFILLQHTPCVKIRSLCRLTRLDSSYNSLDGLPEGIGGLTSLVELVLGNNSIGSLPPAISELQALKTLDLRVNKCAHCFHEHIEAYIRHWCQRPIPEDVGGCTSQTAPSACMHLG